MKIIDGPSKIRKISLIIIVLFIMLGIYGIYDFDKYNKVYSSIKVVVKDNAAIEYGSGNYNVDELIEKVDGKVVSVKDNIDTSVVGEQQVVFEVLKDDVIREVPVNISVKDTTAPVINLKEDKVTITLGDDYDLTSNVDSVSDVVDGDIYYSNEVNEDSNFYYNFNYNQDEIVNVGEHEVEVNAIDKYGNVTKHSFVLEVVAPKVEYPTTQYRYYNDLPANAAGGDLVSLAYSYIGYPYIAGSNGPYGFDCSGFVQYLYSRVGISVSRSTSTQLYDGYPVSYDNAQPGDIIVWGYYDGAPTHSSLYVGNGQMIHATNPAQGVMLSDVSVWATYGTHILAVRRIQ